MWPHRNLKLISGSVQMRQVVVVVVALAAFLSSLWRTAAGGYSGGRTSVAAPLRLLSSSAMFLPAPPLALTAFCCVRASPLKPPVMTPRMPCELSALLGSSVMVVPSPRLVLQYSLADAHTSCAEVL